MHIKTKATNIPMKVKKAVWERDEQRCIICHKSGYGVMPNSHFIPRSKGGLGVEKNIVTMCQNCHYLYDFGLRDVKNQIRHYTREYLRSKYEEWSEEELIYRKGQL